MKSQLILDAVKHIPDWFPGAGFKKIAREWGASLTELTERPYAFVKHQMAEGVNEPSFMSQLLQQPIENADELFTAKCSAMSLLTAGADTVSTSSRTLLAVLISYLDCLFSRLFLHSYDTVPRSPKKSARRN